MKDKFVTHLPWTVNVTGLRTFGQRYTLGKYVIVLRYESGQYLEVNYGREEDCNAMYDKIVAALGAAPEAVTFLPCSHCGREPFQAPQKDVVDGITGGYHVWCWNCKARGPREATPAKAIAAWNRRA